MELHSIHATVTTEGTIVLDDLPFEAGDEVSITVVKTAKRDPNNPYPLRGTPYRYDNPFDPVVPPEDWDALK
jgi:hypothetical protein